MPIRSGVLSFGLVAIPVKVHTAVKDETIRFHLLHEKCGSRVTNRYHCPVCNVVVERDDQARGYQSSNDQYVMFTDAELDSLEAAANRSIDLKEFVQIDKIDPVYFESSHYLGPDEGGEKPYRLLAIALTKTQRAAVAELVSRGKEQIVIIRPYNGGLVMHGMAYQNEVRDFAQIPKGESAQPSQLELDLSEGLIDRLSVDDFDPEEFKDDPAKSPGRPRREGEGPRNHDPEASAKRSADDRPFGSTEAQHGACATEGQTSSGSKEAQSLTLRRYTMEKEYKAHKITSTAVLNPTTKKFGAKVLILDVNRATHELDVEPQFQTAAEAESTGMQRATERVDRYAPRDV
jgi:DNA end-binding protein Ku